MYRWVTFKSHSLWQFLTLKKCTGKWHRSPILTALAQSSYTRLRTPQNSSLRRGDTSTRRHRKVNLPFVWQHYSWEPWERIIIDLGLTVRFLIEVRMFFPGHVLGSVEFISGSADRVLQVVYYAHGLKTYTNHYERSVLQHTYGRAVSRSRHEAKSVNHLCFGFWREDLTERLYDLPLLRIS
jgi:hypothetical protein